MRSMATNNMLKDLFAQIIHSEEKVKERTAKLKQVNNDIESYQAKCEEVKEEIRSFQGDFVMKSQKIAEQELQLKWFCERKRILNEQKQDLDKQKTELQTTLNNIQQDTEKEREQFLAEAEEFCSLYDLISDGTKKRKVDSERELKNIVRTKEKIEKEIENIKNEKHVISVLEEKKSVLLLEIQQLQTKHKDIDDLTKKKIAETEEMEKEKTRVSKRPQSDPEFQKITAELEDNKETSLSLEGICDAMEQELVELQQQLYQKKLQKQRRQREYHQKQQQQQQQQQPNLTEQSQRLCSRKPRLQEKIQRPLFEHTANSSRKNSKTDDSSQQKKVHPQSSFQY